MENLVTASRIEDLVATAYAGEASFDDVGEWAETNWEANDRMKLAGYSAFSPTKRGFQMLTSRASTTLSDHGIERISTTFDAISDGCTITSLADSGPIQAKEKPCAFYNAFGGIDEIVSATPQACIDGSGAHARSGPAAVFTGEEMLIWGGHRGGHFTYRDMAMAGLSFEAGRNQWRRIPPPGMPEFTPEVGAWTGTELIVIGNKVRPDYRVLAAAYDPTARSWRSIDFPFKRSSGFEGVWTGRELLLWGGPSHSEHPSRRGLLYDPVTDAWRKTSPAPGSGRWSHAVVWTGRELIVVGGGNANVELADGLAYNPSTDA